MYVELYDLVADPQEQRNVAAAHSEVVRELLERLRARIDESVALRQAVQAPEAPSAEYLETLRSLGYTGEADEEGGD